jgi:ATP-binding cassette subfamily B protein RtxB
MESLVAQVSTAPLGQIAVASVPAVQTTLGRDEGEHEKQPHTGQVETLTLLSSLIVLGSITQQIDDLDKANELVADLLHLPAENARLEFSKALGLKTKRKRQRLERINPKQLPLAFRSKDNEWIILGQIENDQALIQKTQQNQPIQLSLGELSEIWAGESMLLLAKKGGMQGFDVTWFIPEFMRYRVFAWEILAASAFVELLALISPLFFQVVMDKVIGNNAVSTLDVLVTVLLIVAVLEFFLKGLRQYIVTQTTTRIDARLGGLLFQRLMELPISYFKARSVGVTVMRVTELNSIREFLSGAANTLVIDLSFTFIFFGVMYLFSPFLTLIVACSIPLLFLLSILTTKPLQKRIEKLYQDGAINNAFLNETLGGVETVKSLALEPQMIRRWERQTRDFVESNFRVQQIMQISSNFVQTIQKGTSVLILWFGARMVIDQDLTIGQLIAFNMMANHVMQPITRLSELWRNYVQTRVAIDRLGDVLNTHPERSSAQQKPPSDLQGNIRLNDISFRYAPDQDLILKNFNLDIPARSMVAFVGASGSGKSTVTKLVQKLYVPEAGQVLLDGTDIADVDALQLRQKMSVVLQENYLFNLSVRENIALANPAAPLDDVIRAAKMAGAHDFILELEEGYSTILAEGGTSLSGGQRQRVAIARALMSDPSILIFDEATSALDDHSQDIIQKNMNKIRADRTVILVAHRLSTVRDCDRIFVLDKGNVIESGTHAELVSHKGAYARLWAMQSGSPPPEPILTKPDAATSDSGHDKLAYFATPHSYSDYPISLMVLNSSADATPKERSRSC